MSARSVALAWLVAYLALTAIVLFAAREYTLVVIHVAVSAVAVLVMRPSGPRTTVIGDLLPLFAAPLLYTGIPRVIGALHGPMVVYHDGTIQGWELGLFGTQPARVLAPNMPWQALSELLHAGYLLYYATIFLPPLVLFVRNERRGLGQTVAAITITATVCWTIFALAPVEGPRYAWGTSALVPDGFVRRLTLGLLAAGSSRGTAFPSSHVAIAVVQTVLAFRWQPRLARALAVVTVAIAVGAVYGGFHYAVDAIAGAILGGAIGGVVLATSRSIHLKHV